MMSLVTELTMCLGLCRNTDNPPAHYPKYVMKPDTPRKREGYRA
jgi:hypothetical protein